MNIFQINKTLLIRRKELCLTQSELALRAGVSRRTIIAMESGESDIGLLRFVRILQSLGLEMELPVRQKRPTDDQLAELFKDDDE